jgi:hypothetical protein
MLRIVRSHIGDPSPVDLFRLNNKYPYTPIQVSKNGVIPLTLAPFSGEKISLRIFYSFSTTAILIANHNSKLQIILTVTLDPAETMLNQICYDYVNFTSTVFPTIGSKHFYCRNQRNKYLHIRSNGMAQLALTQC